MSKVSRSVYQKAKEENKRLLKDIRILVGPPSEEKSNTIKKWRSKIRYEQEIFDILKDTFKQYKSS